MKLTVDFSQLPDALNWLEQAAPRRPLTPEERKAAQQARWKAERERLRTAGGPGSGNFGHAGRPGEVGGSADTSGPRVVGEWGGAGLSRGELFDRNGVLSTEVNRLNELLGPAEDAHNTIANQLEGEFNASTALFRDTPAYFVAREKFIESDARYVESRNQLHKLAEEADKANAALNAGLRDFRIREVVDRTQNIADEMSFDASRIDIVDIEPRKFQVGTMQFEEAGHFQPKDGRIEINARQVSGPEMRTTTGVVAHEIAHAQYDEINKVRVQESNEIWRLFEERAPKLPVTPDNIRKTIPDFEERFPVHMLYDRTWGSPMLTNQVDRDRKEVRMIEDDGVSSYSAAYWKNAGDSYTHEPKVERAINETLAEVRRMQMHPNNTPYPGDKQPSAEWAALARGIGELYAKRFGKKK